MNPRQQFEKEREEIRKTMGGDLQARSLTRSWMDYAQRHRYSYQFDWLSRPIIQYPQDIIAMQELIWSIRPDLVLETGIAHGGSLVFSASMLALMDMCDAIKSDGAFDPRKSQRRVLGVDIDIREHNRAAIQAHPLSQRIEMIQGSSIDRHIIAEVHARARDYKRVLVCLDSNHTHDHVLAELEAYAPLTSKGSYCVVFDTVVDDMPGDMFEDRPWGENDNPKTAVLEYLRRLENEARKGLDGEALRFEVDKAMEDKLLVTVAPGGYLRRL